MSGSTSNAAAQWESRKQAARVALVMNGAGATLLLVFIAHLYSRAQAKQFPVADFVLDLAGAFATLIAGLLLVALVHLIDSVGTLFQQDKPRLSRSSRGLGFFCIVVSYGCFAYAAYQTHAAFLDYFPLP